MSHTVLDEFPRSQIAVAADPCVIGTERPHGNAGLPCYRLGVKI